MKKIFRNLMMLVAGMTMLSGMTSCLGEDESDIYYVGYCTISGSLNKGYVLYSDQGDELHVNSASLGSNGFNNYRRAYLYLLYTAGDVKTDANGHTVIYNMRYQDGTGILCMNPMSLTTADSLGVTQTDSIFDITLNSLWLVNGYLNANWQAYYSMDEDGNAIEPTMNLVYDANEANADSLKFTLYYNRHDSIDAPDYYSTGNQVISYDLVALANSLPASDSIVISVKTTSGSTSSMKFARSEIQYPD